MPGELPDFGFEGFIGDYGNKLFDGAKGWTNLPTMDFYFRGVGLLETFGKD
ncbi:unnamed protein product, partial [marine sediment metagenome]